MIANTKKQTLHEHLYAVAVLAKHIASLKTDNKDIQQCCFIAGLYHDQGKIDPQFQVWANKGKKRLDDNGEHIDTGKFSFENHARHNELSTWTFALAAGSERSSKKDFLKKNHFSNQDIRFIDIIKHAIYWHHAKPLRKNDFDDLGAIQKRSITDVAKWVSDTDALMAQIKTLSKDPMFSPWGVKDDEINDTVEDISLEALPAYKTYRLDHAEIENYNNDIYYNAYCNIVRSSVICADKIVSALSPQALSTAIEQGALASLFDMSVHDASLFDVLVHDKTLQEAIEEHSLTFFPESERTHLQQSAALALSKKDGIAALCGAAGCGKTKIALEWARACDAGKLYWIVPRVSVGLGLYHEISSKDYLPNCRVEIFTGEYKLTRHQGVERQTAESEQLTGQVVITTIDQLVNAISTHRNIDIFTDFMLNHAVFDEFHEFINMESFNLLFAEIVFSKRQRQAQAQMLLVSATPNYTFCEALLDVAPEDFVEMASSNNSRYSIEFNDFSDNTAHEQHPLYRPVPSNSIVISNTATRAQLSYLQRYGDENSVLFHSRFGVNDRKALFSQVFDSFKRNGSQQFSVLRSSPIVQASLNITCQHMVTEVTTPENLLQRLGRLDRFGEFSTCNLFIVAVPSSVRIGKIIDNEARFLNSLNVFHTTVAWTAYLSDKKITDVSVTDLYALYKAFHRNGSCRDVILSDLAMALRKSAQSIGRKLSDPLWIKPKAASKDLLKKLSLRGDSRYVQMILAEFTDRDIVLTEEFAFSLENPMTLSVSEFDNGDDSPLNFMSRKHYQITKEGTKYDHHSARLKEAARSSENPIFTSYPPAELAILNEINIPSALVYVNTGKQVVGCMRLETLRNRF